MKDNDKIFEIIDEWYNAFREEKKIPDDESVSPYDLIFNLAQRDACGHIKPEKVAFIINDTIRRLNNLMENPDRKDFMGIFGDDDLWLKFKNGHHQNILRFLSDIDDDDRDRFTGFITERILRQFKST